MSCEQAAKGRQRPKELKLHISFNLGPEGAKELFSEESH